MLLDDVAKEKRVVGIDQAVAAIVAAGLTGEDAARSKRSICSLGFN